MELLIESGLVWVQLLEVLLAEASEIVAVVVASIVTSRQKT